MFFKQVYEKAKKIYDKKFKPLIDWVKSSYIDVQKGPPLKTPSFEKFKQSKIKSLHSKKKKPKKCR